METLLSKRIKEIKDNYQNLVRLEDIYFLICADFGLITDELINNLKDNRNKKNKLKGELGAVSMAVFNREYELSDEYLILKSCKYQLEGFGRLMSGLKVRIESIRAESRGQY